MHFRQGMHKKPPANAEAAQTVNYRNHSFVFCSSFHILGLSINKFIKLIRCGIHSLKGRPWHKWLLQARGSIWLGYVV